MASWAILEEQAVWISQRATGFTIVCERCAELGENFPSFSATIALDALRSTVQCTHGHRVRIEREGR